MIDVSIIIVSYNTKEFLKNCLASLSENITKSVSYEVIVVDNASSDNTVSEIVQEFPGVTVIASKENLGFSKGNNKGVKVAKGRYLLFLNADTLIKEKTLETMVSFMDKTNDVGAATCYLRMPNGALDDAAHRGYPTPWNAFSYFSGLAKIFPKSMFFNGYNLAWCDLDKIHEIDALAGAFMFVRKEAGDEAGWWDEDYFFYGEDLDFCYELKEKGWKIYFVPIVEITHFKGVSGGIKKESQQITTANKETKLRVTNARFDAMRIFYTKHYKTKYPLFVTEIVLRGIAFKKWMTLRSL